MHEEVKYHCRKCGHQSTSKGYLAQHKRAVHEGVNTRVDNQATTERIYELLSLQLSGDGDQ